MVASSRPRRRRRRRRSKSKPAQTGGTVSAEQARGAATTPPADVDNKSDPTQSRDRHNARASKSGTQTSAHRPRGRDGNGRAPSYAALDLGTNNCRLLVAAPTMRGFRVVDAFSRIVRLGEGLSKGGRLAEDAMGRAIDALTVCRDKIVGHSVRRARMIATEACRQAENGGEFISRVEDKTGMRLEIVSRETEAALAAVGCANLIDRQADAVVVFDIGGGSTELVLIDLKDARSRAPWFIADHIVAWTSLPIGVVSMAEKFGTHNVTPELFEAKVAFVEEALSRFPGLTALDAKAPENLHLLGTSGTVTTIAGVHLGLPRYDRRRVDGVWMDPEDITRVNTNLLHMTDAERRDNACIGKDRADLVLAGCAIFEAIRRHWPDAPVRVADRGLREGILLKLMARDGVWRRNDRRARPFHRRRPDGA